MNYYDYTKAEKKTLNKYGIDGCTENNLNCLSITETVTKYEKVGNRFAPVGTVHVRVIPTEYYFNVVSAIPFFKNLGGTETVTRSCTSAGNIPVKIVSTSPDKSSRTVREYQFR